MAKACCPVLTVPVTIELITGIRVKIQTSSKHKACLETSLTILLEQTAGESMHFSCEFEGYCRGRII